ncbi:MAG: DUF4157 domain-containing protein [Candidatus Dechloromonas phosphoritropha]
MTRQATHKAEHTPSQARGARTAHSLAAHSTGYAQGTPGNQTLQHLPFHRHIQTKLTVSDAGDAYDQEADRVADQVMRLPDPAAPRPGIDPAPIRPLSIQRRYPECEDEIHRRNEGTQAENSEPGFAHVESVLRQPGRPLDPPTRAFFEPRFGVDFSAVRIHTDTNAAASAGVVSALAYTVGRDVVFNTGQYSPHSEGGRRLLAHELTHVLQQGGNGVARAVATTAASERTPAGETVSPGISGTDHVQRTTDPDQRGPCDQPRVDHLIDPAFTEARRWRREASAWLEAHLDHIRARGSLARDGYLKPGQRVYDELALLERHFRISAVLRTSLPHSPDDLLSIADLERLGNASYWVRRRFSEVEISPSYLCQANCPRGRTGSDTLGSAVAGSREVTFYTNCFDRQHATTQAGVALHEAFHATFSEFDHDTYSFESGYPGGDALTNAESFSTFAAIVATGSNYRITALPEITIHGGS